MKINTTSFSRLKADGCSILVDGTMADNPPTTIEVADSQLDQLEDDPLLTGVEVKTDAKPKIQKDGTSQEAETSLNQG